MTWIMILLFMSVRSLFVNCLDDFILTHTAGFGPSLVVYGMTIDTPYSTNVSSKTFCQCRSLCFVQPRCSMVSMKKNSDGSTECRYSNESILNVSLSNENPQESFVFIKRNFTEFFGQDGMFYVLKKEELILQKGKEYCASLPNGRLLASKTLKQWQTLLDYIVYIGYANDGTHFHTDLSDQAGKAVFGDGTNYGDTELSNHVPLEDSNLLSVLDSKFYEAVFKNGKLHLNAQSLLRVSWITCQVNPLKIP